MRMEGTKPRLRNDLHMRPMLLIVIAEVRERRMRRRTTARAGWRLGWRLSKILDAISASESNMYILGG